MSVLCLLAPPKLLAHSLLAQTRLNIYYFGIWGFFFFLSLWTQTTCSVQRNKAAVSTEKLGADANFALFIRAF